MTRCGRILPAPHSRKDRTMKSKFSIVFLVMVSVSIASCVASKGSSTRETMNSWKGRHISEVIRNWGAYDHIVSDGAGGSIYIWIRYRQDKRIPYPYGVTRSKGNTSTVSGIVTKVMNEDYERRLATPIKTEMFVRQDGRIYGWRVTGD